MFKTILLAAAMAVAMPASALHVTNFNIQGFNQLVIQSPYEKVYSGAGLLTTDQGDFIGFCVDVPHEIKLGAQNYDASFTTLTNDFGGKPLTSLQVSTIYKLASYGRAMTDTDTRSKVQQAIWTVEYPTKSFTSTKFSALDIAAVITASSSYSATGRVLSPIEDSVQSFVVGSPAMVPEPATWGLMVAGFGMIGIFTRSKKSKVVSA